MTPEEPEGMDPGRLEQLRAMMGNMGQPSGWRPACASCLNGHKVAIIDLAAKLARQGIAEGTQEFSQAMQAAAIAGQALAQGHALGMNGQKPDVIPPVQQADTMLNGTGVCFRCFPAQKQTSLLMAGPNWNPGKLG